MLSVPCVRHLTEARLLRASRAVHVACCQLPALKANLLGLVLADSWTKVYLCP